MAQTGEQQQQQTFDPAAYIRNANEKEQASRDGKPAESRISAEPGKPAEGGSTAGTDGEGDHQPRLPRSVRREMNRLREQLGETRGRLAAYQEMGVRPPAASGKSGETAGAEAKPAADPEPQQKDFATTEEYLRAIGRWEGRKEARKAVREVKDQQNAEQQQQQFAEQIQTMGAKMAEDVKLFDDWDAVAKEASEDPEVEFVPAEHPQLMTLMALSDVQAGVYYHLAKHPKEMEALLALSSKPQEQIRVFHRLEGKVEKLYYEGKPAQGGKGDDKSPSKNRTEPEKGASQKQQQGTTRLPKPSEAAAARGGSTPAGEVSPLLAEGKTLNPAWREQRNQREGLRR